MRRFATWHPQERPLRSGYRPERLEPLPESRCSVILDLGSVQVYNEEAFQYFLVHERQRSRSSQRRFLLLLVDVEGAPARGSTIPSPLARTIFCVLSSSLRETDIFGWYRQNRVAGVVLTHAVQPAGTNNQDRIAERISAVLSDMRTGPLSRPLRVRVFQEPLFPVNTGSTEAR